MPRPFINAFGRFNNMRIHSQLVLVYSIAGLLPMLLMGSFLIGKEYNMVLQQHYDQTIADNQRVKMIALNITFHALDISEVLFYDEQLRSIVSASYSNDSQVYEAYRQYTLPDTYIANYPDISGLKIYVNNKTMLTNGRFVVVTDDIANTYWYSRAAASSSAIFWIVDSTIDRSGYLHLVRKIPLDNAGNFAVLVISISYNYMKLMINDSSFQTVAALNNSIIFFSDNMQEIGITNPIQVNVANPQLIQKGEVEYKGSKVLYSACKQTAIKTADSFQVITIDKDAPGKIYSVVLNGILIVAVSMIVPYVLILLFLNVFNRRIMTLRREMHKVANGDFKIIERFNGHDELSDVFADMKTMIDCISSEKLASERVLTRQQRIEFEMLSSQINPHFLFNTLETIRMKALMNGDREGARIANLLSKSMRHILEVGHAPVSLSSELEYVRIYLEIQALRFGVKIESAISVSESVDTEDYFILPLLLQPIVENSVVHGLEEKDGKGCVKISIYNDDKELFIDISDNGIGMDESDLHVLQDNIRNSAAPQAKAGIGLTNVHQRIKLYYGPAYGLTLESRFNEGTKVILTLPGNGKGLISNDSAVGG